MKKYLLFSLMALTCFLANSQSLTKNIVTVSYLKTETITERTFESSVRAMQAQMGAKLTADQYKELLDSMVNSILLLQAADKDAITLTDEELLKGLRMMFQAPTATLADLEKTYNGSPGVKIQSWSAFLEEVRKQGLKEKYLSKRVVPPVPSEAEIKKAYEENKNNFIMPKSARVSHIFFSFKNKNETDAKNKANEALTKLAGGTVTFEQLVKSSSEDSGSSNKLGDIGYILDSPDYRTALTDVFVNEVFKLKAGQTSKIVASKDGYHILKVTESEAEKMMKLSDTNPTNPNQTIKQLVQMQIQAMTFQQESLKHVENLRDIAKIEMNEANWAPWVKGEKDVEVVK